MEAWWGFAGVILGAVIAGIVSIGGEYLRNEHETKLDSLKRADDRRIESDRIQQETLLALQERLAEWVRTLGAMHHADVMSVRATGKLHLYPEGLSDAEFASGRQVAYLGERLLDEDLRTAIQTFRSGVARRMAMLMANKESVNENRLDADMAALMGEYTTLQDAFGPVLRRYLSPLP